MRVFLILTLFIFGCGKKYTQTYVDPVAQPFVEDFMKEASARGQNLQLKDVVIKLGNANDYNPQINKIGYCLFDRSNSGFELFQDEEVSNIVVLDADFWNRPGITDIQRRELVFHELGHCILGRKHDNRIYNGIPESIMYPKLTSMINPFFYNSNTSKYFDELFKIIDSAVNLNNSNTINLELTENSEKSVFMFTEYGCVEK